MPPIPSADNDMLCYDAMLQCYATMLCLTRQAPLGLIIFPVVHQPSSRGSVGGGGGEASRCSECAGREGGVWAAGVREGGGGGGALAGAGVALLTMGAGATGVAAQLNLAMGDARPGEAPDGTKGLASGFSAEPMGAEGGVSPMAAVANGEGVKDGVRAVSGAS